MQLHAAPGTLLAASPDMLDPNFMHTVVLMARHTEEGAYGLVVNREAGLTVAELFPDHPHLGGSRFPVHWGGPVALDSMQFVHRAPEAIPDGVDLGGGVFVGGDFEALARFLTEREEAARERVRVLLGYSGWGKKQLDDELATGSWVPAPLEPALLFQADQQRTWRRALKLIGEDGLAQQPPDLSWN